MGSRPPESLVREEACGLEQTRAGWFPPEPNPSLIIDKNPTSGLPEGAWCPHEAAVLPIINHNHMNTKLHLSDRGNPSGTLAFASSFLSLNNVSVHIQPRTCAIRVLYRTTNFLR